MQPMLGAPAPRVRSHRLGPTLTKLFPLLAIVGAVLEYLYLWEIKGGGGVVVYALIPLLLLVLGLFTFLQALRHPWRNPAAMALILGFAVAVTTAMFFASVHGIEVKEETSERSRQADDIKNHVSSLVIGLAKDNPKAIQMDGSGVVNLEAMGYTNCYFYAPGMKGDQRKACPYQFKFDPAANQLDWVAKPDFPNPFYTGAGAFDWVLWAGVLVGMWGAVYLYAANLPGPRRERA